jgi:hypothetical protein
MALRRGASTCLLVCLGVGLASSEGCSPQTQLPSIVPRPSDVDRRALNVHDPLPERGIGPDTESRPRGFEIERDEPRRTREAQNRIGVGPHGYPTAPGAVPFSQPGYPSSEMYPDAVRQ